MNRRWTSSKKKINKVIYDILNISENTKDKDCIAADKRNEKKYHETVEKIGNTTKKWENSGVTVNLQVPPPPQPNNYDRLLDYRKKHVLRPAIKQTEATIFLYQNGYVLGEDYEAYQAIDIVEKLMNYNREKREQSKQRNRKTAKKDLSLLNISENAENKRQSMILPTISFPEDPKATLRIKNNKSNGGNYPVKCNKNSGSSLDSLFESDEETFKMFEKNYNNHKQFKSKVNNFQYLAQQNNTQKPDLEPQSYYPPLKDRYDYENNCYSC